MSADRFKQAAKINDSGSWNKYSYVTGDPVNNYDPTGRLGLTTEYCYNFPWDPDCHTDPCPTARDGENGCPADSGNGDGNGNSHDGPPKPSCEDQLVDEISSFLSTKYPSLAGYASIFEIVGASDNIDPRLFAAIPVAENGQARNNPFATGPNGSARFNSIPDALVFLGKTLDKYLYSWNETTVAQLWSGNAWKVDPKKPWITTQYPGYCVGSGCQNTGINVATNLKKQGGDPNSLAFPCKD